MNLISFLQFHNLLSGLQILQMNVADDMRQSPPFVQTKSAGALDISNRGAQTDNWGIFLWLQLTAQRIATVYFRPAGKYTKIPRTKSLSRPSLSGNKIPHFLALPSCTPSLVWMCAMRSNDNNNG